MKEKTYLIDYFDPTKKTVKEKGNKIITITGGFVKQETTINDFVTKHDIREISYEIVEGWFVKPYILKFQGKPSNFFKSSASIWHDNLIDGYSYKLKPNFIRAVEDYLDN
jgi:hypothetical protein